MNHSTQWPITQDLSRMTTIQCPNCGTLALTGDCFCEECGTPLCITPNTDGCEKCGAAPQAIDTEGYCSNCGFRKESQTSDRMEIAVQSNLGGVTDPGLKRDRNEDYIACTKVEGKNAYVLVVCDGVSSSQQPDLAAKVAADTASQSLATALQKGDIKLEEAMKIAVGEALKSVCKIPYTRNADFDPPSTTIVAAVVVDSTVTIGWLGDSRAYWISSEYSRQLTRDDSWLYDVISSGRMNECEARKFPQAHAITRWLGADIGDNWTPSIVKFEIPGSGHLLLCTDGLWNYAPDPQKIAYLMEPMVNANAISLSRGLVNFARSRGGHDNITVVVLSCAGF